MCVVTKTYLQGSSLPLATRALGQGSASAWLGCVHKGVNESDMFSSLPQTTRGRDDGKLRSYMWELATRFGTLNSRIPSLSDVA